MTHLIVDISTTIFRYHDTKVNRFGKLEIDRSFSLVMVAPTTVKERATTYEFRTKIVDMRVENS